MSKPVNDTLIKITEVLRVLNDHRATINTKTEINLINQIEKKILKLETRKRLIIIDGGKK